MARLKLTGGTPITTEAAIVSEVTGSFSPRTISKSTIVAHTGIAKSGVWLSGSPSARRMDTHSVDIWLAERSDEAILLKAQFHEKFFCRIWPTV